MSKHSNAEELRFAVQRFIRKFGLLQVRKTPCGQSFSVSQAHTLMFLLRSESVSPTQTQLALHLALEKSSVTRLVQSLVRSDLVQVGVSPDDRRAKCLSLTAKGRKRAGVVEAASSGLFADIRHHLSDDTSGEIVHALDQLIQAIEHQRSVST
jgi:DNA-binding MarR family transcriptional regulator